MMSHGILYSAARRGPCMQFTFHAEIRVLYRFVYLVKIEDKVLFTFVHEPHTTPADTRAPGAAQRTAQIHLTNPLGELMSSAVHRQTTTRLCQVRTSIYSCVGLSGIAFPVSNIQGTGSQASPSEGLRDFGFPREQVHIRELLLHVVDLKKRWDFGFEV